MNLSGKIRIEAEDFRAQRAAETGEPASEGKGEGEHLRHVDTEPARRARIVDGCAQPAAERVRASTNCSAAVSRPQITMIINR